MVSELKAQSSTMATSLETSSDSSFPLNPITSPSSCNTTNDIWRTLNKVFAIRFKAKIMHQILEENQILYILVGLGIEYDVVVSIVTLDLILTLWKMELLNPTREHNNFKIIENEVVLVVEEVVHRMVVLSHNVSFVENLDTLSKNVTIILTQISLDSGATNHGRNKIHMGNGASLMIAHSSFSLLCSSDLPRVFSLSNLLHVPHITCNLISVSQFARENNVFFEFHPSICIVKDLAMGTPLLKRRLHEGLYRFNLFKAQPFSSTSSHQFSPISSKDYQVLSLKSSRIGGCGLDSPLLSTSNQNDDNVELFTILIL
ncbi:Retrovirus-related Pol polyprotein from transposon RE1 [Vitis vinifera]|uniref:Retrovirus-related Pol polyprotein from transposon RE1 n=1 Tax=Vitis vinifera TaxID=29760 RepID=A0A438KA87_VITVI|nr:Retrovirus-related Pol polyprotein from transposon RE1 [Vitis vinifera]